jgi:hypothetical protein
MANSFELQYVEMDTRKPRCAAVFVRLRFLDTAKVPFCAGLRKKNALVSIHF